MNKIVTGLVSSVVLAGTLYGGTCQDKLSYDFTFYGAKDKSYVVTKNTFKKSKSNFPKGKLLNATIDIDTFSIDTSADLSNGKGKWPPSMANLRNMNTKNNFFKLFEKDAGKIQAKVVKVKEKSIDLEIMMNGVKKVIPFSYIEEGGMIKAKGKLDVLAFNTQKAWNKFSAVCRGFHKGKSWSEIDLFFQVPASCK